MTTFAFCWETLPWADARRALRQKPTIVQNPYIVRKIPLVTVLDEEGLSIIERNADTVLRGESASSFATTPEALELVEATRVPT
jgi:trimethylamine--corrinoid protein Co-methyltransferase